MNMVSGVFTPLLISTWHLGNLDQQGINPIQNLHFFSNNNSPSTSG